MVDKKKKSRAWLELIDSLTGLGKSIAKASSAASRGAADTGVKEQNGNLAGCGGCTNTGGK